MTDPWFTQETARWFPFLSFLALLAALEGPAERGVYRTAVLATGVASTIFGGLLFIAGALALLLGQPRFVSGPLLLSGFVIFVACLGGLQGLRQLYAAAELRKIRAEDM